MKFTLKQLRYFLAVAKHSSVKAASEELHISQPAVSNAIAQLEGALELQLLIRHHAKGVELTPSGREFLIACKGLLAHSDEVFEESRDLANSLAGNLSIGCFSTLGPFVLPKLLKQFNKVCPDVDFQTIEGDIEYLQEALLSGRIELAILYDLNLNDRLDTTVVAELFPHVIVSKKHKLAKRKRISLGELANEPMVLLDLPHSRDYFKSIFDSFGYSPHIKHRTSNFESVRSFVANERGFSLLNTRPASNRTYDNSRLVTLELKEELHSLKVVLATVGNKRRTKRLEKFHEHCVAKVASLLAV